MTMKRMRSVRRRSMMRRKMRRKMRRMMRRKMMEKKIRRLRRRKYQEVGKKGKAWGLEEGNLRRLEGSRRDNLL